MERPAEQLAGRFYVPAYPNCRGKPGARPGVAARAVANRLFPQEPILPLLPFALGLCPATYNRLSLERRMPSRWSGRAFRSAGLVATLYFNHENGEEREKTSAGAGNRLGKWHRESYWSSPGDVLAGLYYQLAIAVVIGVVRPRVGPPRFFVGYKVPASLRLEKGHLCGCLVHHKYKRRFSSDANN